MIVLTMKNTTVFNITISLCRFNLRFNLSISVYIVRAKQVHILSLWFLGVFFNFSFLSFLGGGVN